MAKLLMLDDRELAVDRSGNLVTRDGRATVIVTATELEQIAVRSTYRKNPPPAPTLPSKVNCGHAVEDCGNGDIAIGCKTIPHDLVQAAVKLSREARSGR